MARRVVVIKPGALRTDAPYAEHYLSRGTEPECHPCSIDVKTRSSLSSFNDPHKTKRILPLWLLLPINFDCPGSSPCGRARLSHRALLIFCLKIFLSKILQCWQHSGTDDQLLEHHSSTPCMDCNVVATALRALRPPAPAGYAARAR